MTSKHCPESAPSLASASCNAYRHVFASLAPTLKNTGITLRGAEPGCVQKGMSVFVGISIFQVLFLPFAMIVAASSILSSVLC